MSKRLQIVVDDEEAHRYQACARAEGLTLSAWVRQTLKTAEREVSVADPGRKLAAIRAAAEYAFPAPDIAVMLEEVERLPGQQNRLYAASHTHSICSTQAPAALRN